MLHIGICDSNLKDCELLKCLCEEYSKKEKINIKCISFTTGEEFFDFCRENNHRFDVLFLEIELKGMSWLEIKNRLETSNIVREIIFFTNKKEYMQYAFDMKVRGFEIKPADSYKVERLLNMVVSDIQRDMIVKLERKQELLFSRIYYFASEGTYTRIFYYSDDENKYTSYLSSKPIKDWEIQLNGLPVMRVHKSYMVNLFHVNHVGEKIKIDSLNFEIPVGRAYKKEVNRKYMEFKAKNDCIT